MLVGDVLRSTSRSVRPQAAGPSWRRGCGPERRTRPSCSAHRLGDRDRQHAVALQQRHRLEMRVGAAVSVDAGTRVHDVEMRVAARTPQHGVVCGRSQPAVQRRARQRLTACGRSGRGRRTAGHRPGRPAPWCPPPRTRRPLPARGRRASGTGCHTCPCGCVRTRLIRTVRRNHRGLRPPLRRPPPRSTRSPARRPAPHPRRPAPA